MSVRVVFECDGCDAKAEGTASLRKRFTSVSGRDYGIGTARWETTADEIVPPGWVAADPYTYCTYCPTCWDNIEPAAAPPTSTEGTPE